MADERPRFTRRTRTRLTDAERARLIADFAGEATAIEDDPDLSAKAVQPPDDEWPAADGTQDPDIASGSHIESAERSEPIPPESPTLPPSEYEPEADEPAEQIPDTQAEVTAPAEVDAGPDLPQPDRTPADITAETGPAPAPATVWAALRTIPVDARHLEKNLIITAGRHDPAHGAFDVLRTRLVETLDENGWKRVAVTSPTRDCGKTFTAVNLAISLSRYEAMHTVLMDMDMRNPSVADVLGARDPGAMADFLKGECGVEDHFLRLGRNNLNIGANLAVALNSRSEPFAAELIQDPRTDAAFTAMMQRLDPDVVLYDLPPALAYDDVIAFKKHFDGVLMVVGGGTTTADQVHEAMRRIGEGVPLLGVVLNQAETEPGNGYSYGD